MSVVVRMEMPKACWSCGLSFVCKAANDFMTTKEAGCSALKVGMEGCLIVCSLPEGHGRLVDADALFDKVYEFYGYDNEDNENWMMGMINDAPTIVQEAERSET